MSSHTYAGCDVQAVVAAISDWIIAVTDQQVCDLTKGREVGPPKGHDARSMDNIAASMPSTRLIVTLIHHLSGFSAAHDILVSDSALCGRGVTQGIPKCLQMRLGLSG